MMPSAVRVAFAPSCRGGAHRGRSTGGTGRLTGPPVGRASTAGHRAGCRQGHRTGLPGPAVAAQLLEHAVGDALPGDERLAVLEDIRAPVLECVARNSTWPAVRASALRWIGRQLTTTERVVAELVSLRGTQAGDRPGHAVSWRTVETHVPRLPQQAGSPLASRVLRCRGPVGGGGDGATRGGWSPAPAAGAGAENRHQTVAPRSPVLTPHWAARCATISRPRPPVASGSSLAELRRRGVRPPSLTSRRTSGARHPWS